MIGAARSHRTGNRELMHRTEQKSEMNEIRTLREQHEVWEPEGEGPAAESSGEKGRTDQGLLMLIRSIRLPAERFAFRFANTPAPIPSQEDV